MLFKMRAASELICCEMTLFIGKFMKKSSKKRYLTTANYTVPVYPISDLKKLKELASTVWG